MEPLEGAALHANEVARLREIQNRDDEFEDPATVLPGSPVVLDGHAGTFGRPESGFSDTQRESSDSSANSSPASSQVEMVIGSSGSHKGLQTPLPVFDGKSDESDTP